MKMIAAVGSTLITLIVSAPIAMATSDSQYVQPPSGRYWCVVSNGASSGQAHVACEPTAANGRPGAFLQGPVGGRSRGE